jgi:hypothetical protein
MNLQNIFSEIETKDEAFYERMDTRRGAMKQFARVSGKVAVAAMPFMLGSMFKKAYGQTNTDVINTLKFALTLEYLEAFFYQQGVASVAISAAAGAQNTAGLTIIRDHENQHVQFLRATLTALGDNTAPVMTAANFDYSGGNGSGTGPFAGVFTNYDIFLAVAQTFEDTGVRAYKGGAPSLMNNNDVLTAALRIHSVEARHAAHIRHMRRVRGSAVPGPLYAGVNLPKPWIENAESNIGGAAGAIVQSNYAVEDNVSQQGINTATVASVSNTVASRAFDEPLLQPQVMVLIDPFII